MSRNFELLNQMGKGVAFQPEAEPRPVPVAEVPSFLPSLAIEGIARDEITKLVHRTFLLAGAEGPRRVVFTATESGNGGTWVCAHAAEMLASQVNRSVCIVDCNLKAPSLHKQFMVPNHHGLADALQGEGPVRQYATQLQPNLWLVSCGASCEGALGLLTSDRMRRRVAELGAEFDYVLFDVGPLNAFESRRCFGPPDGRCCDRAEGAHYPSRLYPGYDSRAASLESKSVGYSFESAYLPDSREDLQPPVSAACASVAPTSFSSTPTPFFRSR